MTPQGNAFRRVACSTADCPNVFESNIKNIGRFYAAAKKHGWERRGSVKGILLYCGVCAALIDSREAAR